MKITDKTEEGDKYSQSYSSRPKAINDPELLKIKQSLDLKHHRNKSNSIDQILENELLSDLNTHIPSYKKNKTLHSPNKDNLLTIDEEIRMKKEWTPINTESSCAISKNKQSDMYEYYICTESNNTDILQKTSSILNNSAIDLSCVEINKENQNGNLNVNVNVNANSGIPTFRGNSSNVNTENPLLESKYNNEENVKDKFGLHYNYCNRDLMKKINTNIKREYYRHDQCDNEPKKKKHNFLILPEQVYKNNYDKFSVNIEPYFDVMQAKKLSYHEIFNQTFENKQQNDDGDEKLRIKIKEIQMDEDYDNIPYEKKVKIPPETIIMEEIMLRRNRKEIEELYKETFKKLDFKGKKYSHYHNNDDENDNNEFCMKCSRCQCEINKPNEMYRRKIIKK